MPGASFSPGQTMVRPGVYVNVNNVGPLPPPQQGVVAAIFQATWGPLGVVTPINDMPAVSATFGPAGTTLCPTEAFLGGALQVLAYRLTGTGNAKASYTVKDTNPTSASIATLTAKYDGSLGNALQITIRQNLTNSANHDLLIYNGTALVETWTYNPGSDEAAAIVTATATSGWIVATKIAIGTGAAALITGQSLTGGADPSPAGTDYTNAMNAFSTSLWNVMVTDSESPTIHASLQSYIDRVRSSDGLRVMAVVGEPTAVALGPVTTANTRQYDANARNDLAIVYVGNGFTRLDANGNTLTIEGYKAASRVAGMIAALPITGSLTYAGLPDATGLVGAMVNSDIINCIQSGMLVFSYSPTRLVQVEYGITTLTIPPSNLDNGWKKIRRVRTRDYLIGSIVAGWANLIGRVSNNPDGQQALIAQANRVIKDLVRQGALLGGSCFLDPQNPPQGDSAWFVLMVDDVDSAEHLYLTAGFEFTAVVQ